MRKEKFKNSSHIELKDFYEPSDLAGSLEKDLGKPGEFPFTRGVQSTMYRGKLWTMRQYAGFGSAQESNERYKLLLKSGTTGLSVAFDLPTQMGYDSDHIMSTGEVGKVGVAISSLEDMEILLEGLPLDKISTSMTINSTAGILLAFYIAVAKKRGISPKVLNGTIQNDLLKEYIARGTYIYPPRASLRLITDIFAYCAEEVPLWNTISISGYHIREAGSTAVQELAFTLANAVTYVEAAIEQGLDVNTFGKRLSFFFNVHNNFFEEIAKYRAARRLWAKLMKDRFKATDPKAMMLRFHSQTAGSTLTAQQPQNNIVRVSLQALASVLGGTQSLHTNSMDEALGLPTAASARIALRTQQIIACETGVADVIDPLAGSYYVESLTDELERKALEYIERIESLGGVVKCIEQGWLQREIQNSAYQTQRGIESGEEMIVGVNCYEEQSETPVEILRISEEVSASQIERLKVFKNRRDLNKVKIQLTKLENAASQESESNSKRRTNLMPLIVEAVENNATLGEISDVLRKVFGQYRETITL